MDRGALIERLRSTLEGTAGVEVAILFGSRAREAERDDSDVDLAVLAPGVDLVRLAATLEDATGLALDVTNLSDPPFSLLLLVLRDGRRVYERRPGGYARYTAGALADLETDLPALRRMQHAFAQRVANAGILTPGR